ncbi:MAG: hypothetical protein QOK37_3700 [Thermoanaerobaculia bacterium]|nr:hypothetical protein [Thermoanaerobaculia bacterium]
MIDQPHRGQLMILLRDLSEGAASRDQFRAPFSRSDDLAVREIAEQAWLLCRDLPEPGSAGRKKRLREARGEVSRWILFLESEREYEWPSLSPLARVLGFIPSLISFGLFWAPYRWWFKRSGDYRVWPFIDEQQFQGAQSAIGRRKRG